MTLQTKSDMRPISTLLNENSHRWTRAAQGSTDGKPSVTIVSDSKEQKNILADLLIEDYSPMLTVKPDEMRQIVLISKDDEGTQMLVQLCEDIKEALN